MQGLLAVEPSATLRHLLERTMRAGDLGPATFARDYAEGHRLLAGALSEDRPYRALIVGAPSQDDGTFAPLLNLLKSEQSAEMPVLMLAHARQESLNAWLSEREAGSLALWSDFSRIPSMLQELAPLPKHAAGDPDGAADVRILFVDDSQSIRYAYQKLLRNHGYRVETAGSIAEALDAARAGDFDLVICDYFLPDGNGDEICRRLREESGDGAPTLAVITGQYRESVIKRCLEAGAVECMFKNEARELFLTRVHAMARLIRSRKSVDKERHRLRDILATVGEGVYGVDRTGVVTFMNRVGLRMLGYSKESQVVGHVAHAAFHDANSSGRRIKAGDSELHRAYLRGNSLNKLETTFWTCRRKSLPVECTVLPQTADPRSPSSVVVFRDISDRKDAEKLRFEASHDPVTKVGNHRHFHQAMDAALRRRAENGGYDALAHVEIERFDDIKLLAGDNAAEGVLADVASKLATRLKDSDELARLGANRFGVLVSGIRLGDLFSLAEALREIVSECRFRADGRTDHVTGSIGVTVLSSETPSVEYALETAREASLQANKKGRNFAHIAVGTRELSVTRELEAVWNERFREAQARNQFLFLAQPIVDVRDWSPGMNPDGPERWRLTSSKSGGGDGYLLELLLRMVSRDGKWITPSVFVPMAEQVGAITPIDIWVVRNAVQQLAELDAAVAFTVNLSSTTIQSSSALNEILELVTAADINPWRLVFEITETVEIEDTGQARRFVHRLKQLGCRFALDDFGTGFSSFSHLKHFPVDFVKIDGQFIEGIASNEVDRTMVTSMAAMASSLAMRTIAEQVDSLATFSAVRASGADFAQGNFLGKPAPLANIDFEDLSVATP